MHMRTTMLIPGGGVGWSDLRAALRSLSEVRLVGEATDADDAAAMVKDSSPEYIFSTTALAGKSTLPLLAALRQHAPASRILIFAPRLDPAELAPYAAFGTAGYILWPDMTPEGLRACLIALFEGNMHISSQEAVDTFMEMQHDPTAFRKGQVRLTDRERAVLQRLAEGLTQKQAADEEGMSERTVKRIVSSLQEKLDAPCQFALGARAAQLGLIAQRNDPKGPRN